MSDALELCVGDSHIVTDIFLLNILAMDSMVKTCHIRFGTLYISLVSQERFLKFGTVWGKVSGLKMCETIRLTFSTRDLIS